MHSEAYIRSIARSLAVLRAVNRSGSMSMMEIANAVNIPYPTACRIVYTLQEEGMLERESSRKRYRPTALVQSLSHGYQDHSNLVDLARSELETLTNKHFWPLSLTTRVGLNMVVRDCTHQLSPMALTNYQPGAAFPLLECASGHVMLAFTDDEQRHRWLDATENCDVPPDGMVLKMLRSNEFAEQIRENGYALRGYNQFTDTPGRTSSLAVPIFHNGEVSGALTLIFFSVAMQLTVAVDRYVADLKVAAAAISKKLSDRDLGLGIAPRATKSKADVQSANFSIA